MIARPKRQLGEARYSWRVIDIEQIEPNWEVLADEIPDGMTEKEFVQAKNSEELKLFNDTRKR